MSNKSFIVRHGLRTENNTFIVDKDLGTIGIGDVPDSNSDLKITGTKGIKLPSPTTAQRTSGPPDGVLIFNSTTGQLELSSGGAFNQVSSIGGSTNADTLDFYDSTDFVFVANNQGANLASHLFTELKIPRMDGVHDASANIQIELANTTFGADFTITDSQKTNPNIFNYDQSTGILDLGSVNVSVTLSGDTIWTNTNDGAGSGLDADKLDGLEPTTTATINSIVKRDSSANITANNVTVSGTVDGRDISVDGTSLDNIVAGNITNDFIIDKSTPLLKLSATSTDTATVQVGLGRSGDGISKSEYFTDSSGLSNLTVSRAGGANGISSISHKGTGGFKLIGENLCDISFLTNNVVRGSISSGGAWSLNGNTLSTGALSVSGDITIISTGELKLDNNKGIKTKDSGGTYQNLMFMGFDDFTNVFVAGGAGSSWRVLNQAGSADRFHVTEEGEVNIPTGPLIVAGITYGTNAKGTRTVSTVAPTTGGSDGDVWFQV